MNHLTKPCSLAPDHPLQRCILWFERQGSAFPCPLRAVYESYHGQLEPETGLRISERPSWVMPPWQSLQGSVRSPPRQCSYVAPSLPGCLYVLWLRKGKMSRLVQWRS